MKLKRKISLFLATLAVACGGVVGFAGANAHAAVTNCTKYIYDFHVAGICTSTNGNPPYTTQFRVKVLCWNPVQQTSPWAYGAWRTAKPYVNQSSYSDAWCPTGSVRQSTGSFEFR